MKGEGVGKTALYFFNKKVIWKPLLSPSLTQNAHNNTRNERLDCLIGGLGGSSGGDVAAGGCLKPLPPVLGILVVRLVHFCEVHPPAEDAADTTESFAKLGPFLRPVTIGRGSYGITICHLRLYRERFFSAEVHVQLRSRSRPTIGDTIGALFPRRRGWDSGKKLGHLRLCRQLPGKHVSCDTN